MPPHDLIGMVYFLHQVFFTIGIIIILIVTGAGFHSSDSTGRIPQPGLLSQDSTARIPQPGLHSTARIPQPGIHSQNSTTTIPQPGFHSWAPGVVTETLLGPFGAHLRVGGGGVYPRGASWIHPRSPPEGHFGDHSGPTSWGGRGSI